VAQAKATKNGIGNGGWIGVVALFITGAWGLTVLTRAPGVGIFWLLLFWIPAVIWIFYHKKQVDRYRQLVASGIEMATNKKEEKRQAAAETLLMKAESGYSDSMLELGEYLEARGQEKKALDWFKQAAGKSRGAKAIYAKRLYDKGETSEAFNWYEKAAKAGDVDGMFGLAVLLHEQGKLIDAKEWYIAAAKANHPGATSNLGLLLYSEGDLQGAKDLYMSAIGAGGEGSQDAMCNLGQLLYDTGDKVGAMVWYRRAAEAGQQTAMLNLSQMLAESGNIEEAAEWRALSGE
jgi:TPR repeat protein